MKRKPKQRVCTKPAAHSLPEPVVLTPDQIAAVAGGQVSSGGTSPIELTKTKTTGMIYQPQPPKGGTSSEPTVA